MHFLTIFFIIFTFSISTNLFGGSSLDIYGTIRSAWDNEAASLRSSSNLSFDEAKYLLREKYLQLFKNKISKQENFEMVNHLFRHKDFIFLGPLLECMKEKNIKWRPTESVLPANVNSMDFKNEFIYYACRDSRNTFLLKNLIDTIDDDALKVHVQRMILMYGLRNHDLELIEQVVPNMLFTENHKELFDFFVSEDQNVKTGGLKAFLRLQAKYRFSHECVSEILLRVSKNSNTQAQEIVTCARKLRSHYN